MQRRLLGGTGVEVSVVGMGGVVVAGLEQPEADRIVSEAMARGVTYFDVSPTYGDAEERLGPALRGHRDEVFLACKTGERSKQGAAQELRRSLRRLGTDHFDLYQLHGLKSQDEVNQVTGPGGAIEALVEAREAGLADYLGSRRTR